MSDKNKILKKIQALMAKTVENGASEKEALSATSKAAMLLEKYNLSMQDVDLENTNCDEGLYKIGKKQSHPVSYLCSVIGELTGTKVMLRTDHHEGSKYIVYFGLKHDIQVALYITEIIHKAMEREFKIFKKTFDYKYSNMQPKTKRHSFMMGMVMRLQERIAVMIYEKEQRRKEQNITTGTSLVVVKDEMVAEEFDDKYGELEKVVRKPNPKSRTALVAGMYAGDKVEITPGLTSEKNGDLDR